MVETKRRSLPYRLGCLILLPVMPWNLAAVAGGLPTMLSLPIGVAAWIACGAIVVAAWMVPGGEPFRDIREYLESVVGSAVIIGGVTYGVVTGVIVFLGLAAAAINLIGDALGIWRVRWPWQRSLAVQSRVHLAWCRVLLLAPLCLVLPVTIWSASSAICAARAPSFGLIGGKPAWIDSPAFDVLAHVGWFFVGMSAFFLLGAIAIVQVERLVRAQADAKKRNCARCGYPRHGLPTGADCPECGEAPR